MYQGFYNLTDHPFRLTPDPEFVCMTTQHREALSGLVYSIYTRPGLTVLTGEAGTGKTTLLYTLTDLLEKRRCVTAMCNNPTLTREEFYDFLLIKLGVECASSLKSRQLISLQEKLLSYRAEGRPAVLVIDEAQRMPLELLEEIRLLMNLETPKEKLLQIIMAGQQELGDVLRRPELRQLKQRVSCVCRLAPLSADDVREYLQHRLSRAGLRKQELFSDQAMQMIFEYTAGIPRLVNSLCESAMQTGFALRSERITLSIIREAAKDLDLREPGVDHLKLVGNGAARAVATSSAGAPVTAEDDAKGAAEEIRVVTDGYTARQRSLGFLSNLMERWR